MSNTPEGTDPVVFKTPTLGHAVRLGELYDQRSGQFLGVQLYAEDSIQVAETDIKHTQLSLSLSTTLEDKASLLDIYAKLSLEIMSGAISVTGSASYIKDTKSNTNEQAFALALKMRLNEKRVLFAEDALGRNVLRVASEDYIATGSATHFVSGITYGGNFIVNLVARQSQLEEDEKIEGQLQVKLNYMKGAISLEGEAKAKITDEFKSMDDKFDLVVCVVLAWLNVVAYPCGLDAWRCRVGSGPDQPEGRPGDHSPRRCPYQGRRGSSHLGYAPADPQKIARRKAGL